MIKKIKQQFVILAVLMAIVGVYFLMWYVQRTVNYKFSYEGFVIDSICAEVDQKYLKHPEKCN